MNVYKDKYIILELIPSHSKSELGNIIQLQALKLEGLKLISRFDYRLEKEQIKNEDLLKIISYDEDMFTYVKNSDIIMKNFKNFSENLPLLIIDNDYTLAYLKDLKNKKESVFKYLGLKLTNDVFNELIIKYNLEPSNHLVDLLYEGLIKNNNN